MVKLEDFFHRVRDFFVQKKWSRIKKSDWIVIALVGVLLLIIAIPVGEKKEDSNLPSAPQENESQTKKNTKNVGEDYTEYLEKKLEQVLAQMEGVGQVEVMITVLDQGESIVEKDVTASSSVVSETDSSGGTRSTTEEQNAKSTVYIENSEGNTPYVQREKMPTIVGIVVVAEGGGNSKIVSDISEAVEALFQVEMHRIKVVKMCSKEEST